MTYSFTKAKNKPLLTSFGKIWFFLFSLSILFIFAIYMLYVIRIGLAHNGIYNKEQETIHTKEEIKKAQSLYELLVEQNLIANKYNEHNEIMKNSLKNLFDMVIRTDSIKLDSFDWEQNTLTLSGVSPTKEMFSLLLETPLRSVFDETYTSYYKLTNGWYRFVSINKKQILEEN
ncbi:MULTISPECIES: hypothetical protein [unclassified Campylobacter]|uniref:hypothetical protein n=1 Tax=unclassified Campylobacter TaxID=2593542 RepID=UPI00123812F3|nr:MULTISPECIES: hypothetical protein [unclassified Campylobacter]KAA6224954.1 hypothetical protein FMM57_08255 [Campylobacter sp. LR286c]KAA6228868.1 hypothetical protein FMM55_00100 [Campylobacter sp. LR196d]